jgi:acyl-coenzyme A synthetase/AMP-(fatty) acid ligase
VLPPGELATRVGSVGVPIGEMSVVARRPDGEPAAPGETAELYVDGPLLMLGYLDEAELTAEALTEYGFRTGDFGHVDADGYVWIEGRKDDIIKRGGEKVSTIQVQQALLNLGLFHDAAVLAAPDELLGHVPVAFVVPRDPETFKASRVLRELRRLLPPVAHPSRVIAVDAVPRTGSGKAIRGDLQALLAQELG